MGSIQILIAQKPVFRFLIVRNQIGLVMGFKKVAGWLRNFECQSTFDHVCIQTLTIPQQTHWKEKKHSFNEIIKFITSIIALENANETQQQKIST